MNVRLNSTLAAPRRQPAALDADAVRSAYKRWASIYDTVFGGISAPGRRRAVAAVNALPGRDVLEVGVGTGLALPHYLPQKRVTGIDLSADMLALARTRVVREELTNVVTLQEQDAEATSFADGHFDVAVAMFVASVVPSPRRLLAEMRRVVKPGGTLLFVNHFAATGGIRLAVERAMAPAGRALGWHPDFKTEALLPPEDLLRATSVAVPPVGLFTLVSLPN
jgi:phosphatidylethanolamine/phosphatidyl-N-methylethanolamine N-methyltransferase